MERLKEEEQEEETGEDKLSGRVRFPNKGQDYVVLPTSDQPQDAAEIQRQRRRRVFIIGGAISAVVILLVIVLCVVLLKKPGINVNDEDPTESEPLPDTADRITCTLAGLNPSKGMCQVSGCEFRSTENPDGSTSRRCVYPKESSYSVESKTTTSTTVRITLKLADESSPQKRDAVSSQADNLNSTLDTTNGDKDTGGDEEEVKSNPLAILPGTLYVLITNEGGSSLRIKVSASQSDDSDDSDEETGPPSKRGLTNSNFNLTTAGQGDPFYIIVRRISTDGKDKVILDTREHPLIVSHNFVQFTGVFGAPEILSNGKKMASGDNLVIWNSEGNSNLPYFYGIVGKANPQVFGVAMGSPAPMKISFGARKGSAMVVDIAQLGGDLEMLLFMGPSKKDVATQFVQTFGLPNRTPWWSLGTLVHHEPNEAINSTQFKIDVLVLDNFIDVPDDSQQIKSVITYVDPLVQMGLNANDPPIRTAEGDYFVGTLSRSEMPGSFRAYVDYTHPMTDYDNQIDSLYLANRAGHNLRHNYPLNFADLNCTDNVINNSPFLSLSDKPLFNGTMCLDYIHTGKDHTGKTLRGLTAVHRLIHNRHGTLQAKILHRYRSMEGDSFIQISDSVSLGAGQYTAKYIEITTREDLLQLIPMIIWYGNVGLLATTRLAPGVTDKEMILKYHKLNGFLLLTSGDESALSKLDSAALADIKEFIKTKYHLYPEWLTALHKCTLTTGLPVIREMSFNFPGDVLLAGPDHGLQFMVGDKIVVAAGVLLGSETSVYLPTSQNETWYRRNQNSYQRVVPQKGKVTIDSSEDPSQLYFIKGGSVLMTSRLSDIDKMSGNPIETVKLEYVELTILLSGTETSETIYETYYLREQDDLLLQVAVSVDSMPDGVRIIIQPTGEALEKSSSDERTWNQIMIAAGGLRGKVSHITINGNRLSGISYSYDAENWEESSLSILEDSDMNTTPSLHKTYDIMIYYKTD